MPASPTFNAPTQHQSDGAEKISSGPHFPSFTVDPRFIMTAVEMPSASFVLNNIPVEHPSVQSMFAPGVPAAPRCLLCCQHGHWYSRCRLFNGKQVCFFNERDHRVIVMDRDDWICGTVLADVFRFLRPITGLTPSQYHLIIHQQKVIAPRDTPCCDIGILPGAYVSVMVVDSFRYLLCPPSVIALRDQLRVHRHHHDDQQQQTVDTCTVPPLPPSQSVASDAPSHLALETETNQPSKEDESESTYDGNVSHISVASTSLMQSVPGTENSRLVVESEGVAETTTTTVSEDGAVPPAPEAAILLHNSSTNTTAVSVVEASANESCGSVVVYLDRPSGIAAWADLSVGSIHSRHTPPQMPSGDNETKKNTAAAAAATPGNAMSTPKPSVDAQNRLSRPGTKTVNSKGKDDDDHHHHHKEDPATVNVKFLPATMSFADMRAMFFSIGEVLKVRVVSPSDDEVPVEQRFSVAFVEYKYREDALQFISTYHRHRCGRFQLRVEMSKKGILGGYITDAVGDYPCTFGLPQSMVKVRGSDKSVDACGASSIATAAGTTPSRKSTNAAANTSAHKSPSSSRHQRGALDTTDGGAYKLTPKVRSPKTMQQYASLLQQEFSTPVRRPTSCRNGDDDIEGAHPPTIAKATTTGELLLLQQHDKAIVGISNRALVARSGDDEGSHFRRPRAVISAQVGLLKNFSTVRNTIDEYLATGVEATFYNALRQLEELSTRFRLSPGYADTSSVLNRSNGGDTASTTATTTTSAALPSVRIDILVLRCALVIHYGASKTIDEYLSDIVAEIVSMTERTSIMESNRWTDLDGVHLVESLLTAAALIQRRRSKVSRMLISQCRALVSSNMVAGLDNRRRKSISRLCDDNNSNKQKEEDCRVRPLWEYLFPNVLSEWNDGSIDAREVAGACAQEVLQMQPTMDFALAL